MLCDTCIYKYCGAIICSECKFLVSDGLIDICYCNANKFCDGKIFEDKVLIKCKYYHCDFNCKDCKMFQTPGDEDYPYNCYCVGHPCDDCKYYEVDNEEH